MATLAGKTILVIGGSSGIGYGVAKAALLSRAAHVIISSSSQQKVDAAVSRLKNDISTPVEGTVSGKTVDGRDSASVKALLAHVGEVDHLVWTSGDLVWTGGDPLRSGISNLDLDKSRGVFDVRFWGAFTAAQAVKICPGGSITSTVGSILIKPHKGWSLRTGIVGAVDALARGLAVDLAPVRVNVVSPGMVKTELWDHIPSELKNKAFEDGAKTLLVQHVAEPDEIAEAYLFLMKCGYITGQRIEVDGGAKYV